MYSASCVGHREVGLLHRSQKPGPSWHANFVVRAGHRLRHRTRPPETAAFRHRPHFLRARCTISVVVGKFQLRAEMLSGLLHHLQRMRTPFEEYRRAYTRTIVATVTLDIEDFHQSPQVSCRFEYSYLHLPGRCRAFGRSASNLAVCGHGAHLVNCLRGAARRQYPAVGRQPSPRSGLRSTRELRTAAARQGPVPIDGRSAVG